MVLAISDLQNRFLGPVGNTGGGATLVSTSKIGLRTFGDADIDGKGSATGVEKSRLTNFVGTISPEKLAVIGAAWTTSGCL